MVGGCLDAEAVVERCRLDPYFIAEHRIGIERLHAGRGSRCQGVRSAGAEALRDPGIDGSVVPKFEFRRDRIGEDIFRRVLAGRSHASRQRAVGALHCILVVVAVAAAKIDVEPVAEMHGGIGKAGDFLIFGIERGDGQRAQRINAVQRALGDRDELLINQALFLGVIAANDPVDKAAFRGCQPHFLREFLRPRGLVEIDLVGKQAERGAQVERQVVAELLLKRGIAGRRGERREAEIIVDHTVIDTVADVACRRHEQRLGRPSEQRFQRIGIALHR